MTPYRDREAWWAGEFYPADPHDLAATVRSALDAALPVPPDLGRVKAIVSPHAGYRYSGAVAGTAWAATRHLGAGPAIDRVVLLGPSHRVPVDGIAVSRADTWTTPLGPLPMDGALREYLVRTGLAHVNDDAHRQEHSLEVQLPFLQGAIGPVTILPMVVGHGDPLVVATMLDEAWDGPGTLVAVSSDLSHYHDQAAAETLDHETAELILAGRVREVLPDRACGAAALRGLLVAAREHGLTTTVLDLRTSADTSGDRTRVVGYGAFVFTEPIGDPDRLLGVELVRRARRAIRHAFTRQRHVTTNWDSADRRLARPGAAFVSLHDGDELRGCVGSLTATEPLGAAVVRAALAAAFEDTRFPTLTATEYLDCSVTVSVLSESHPLNIGSWDEAWSAIHRGDGATLHTRTGAATLLPAVWEQFGTVDAFLDALWSKAGAIPRTWTPGHRVEVYSTEEYTG